MFCGQCGYEPVDQGDFCPDCGHSLELQKRSSSGPELPFADPDRAGFWTRFVAHGIDVAIIWGVLGVYWTTGSSLGGYWTLEIPHGIWLFVAMFFSTPLVLAVISAFQFGVYAFDPLIYFFVALVVGYYIGTTAYWGSTPGKRVMGIVVVGSGDDPPHLFQVVVRETLGKALSLIFWVGFLMVAGSKKRGLHDFLAGTRVVHLAAKPQNVPQKRTGVGR